MYLKSFSIGFLIVMMMISVNGQTLTPAQLAHAEHAHLGHGYQKSPGEATSDNDQKGGTPRKGVEFFIQRSNRISSEIDPEIFNRTSKKQTPSLYTIGCSDSRVPNGGVLGAEIGEIFSTRNIANRYDPSSSGSVSALDYAVESLEIPHLVVIGHEGCGGVEAALDLAIEEVENWSPPTSWTKQAEPGLINWLTPIKKTALRMLGKLYLQTIFQGDPIDPMASFLRSTQTNLTTKSVDRDDLLRRLIELNVREQVEQLVESSIVQKTWSAGKDLQIHGWVYDIRTGRTRVLETRRNPGETTNSSSSSSSGGGSSGSGNNSSTNCTTTRI